MVSANASICVNRALPAEHLSCTFPSAGSKGPEGPIKWCFEGLQMCDSGCAWRARGFPELPSQGLALPLGLVAPHDEDKVNPGLDVARLPGAGECWRCPQGARTPKQRKVGYSTSWFLSLTKIFLRR